MSLTPRLDKLDRNYIINGAMDFWQRGTSLTNNVTGADSSASLYKQADRFVSFVVRNGADIGMTFTKVTDAPAGTGLKYCTRATSNYNTALGATSAGLIPFYQRIEGNMVNRLVPSQSVYVSGWVKCNIAATISVCLDKSLEAGGSDEQSYVFDTSVLANTWTFFYKKIDLPAQEIYKGTDTSFTLLVGAIFGSTGIYAPTGLVDQWNLSSPARYCSTSATNWAATSGNWVQLTGLKLSDQPHSEFSSAGKNYAEELRLCQRYYEKTFDIDTTPANGVNATTFLTNNGLFTFVASNGSSVGQGGYYSFKATKRTNSPIITAYGNSNGHWQANNTWSVNAYTLPIIGQNGLAFTQQVVAGLTAVQGHFTVDAEI